MSLNNNNSDLRDPNMHYPLARLVGEVKEKSNIYNKNISHVILLMVIMNMP